MKVLGDVYPIDLSVEGLGLSVVSRSFLPGTKPTSTTIFSNVTATLRGGNVVAIMGSSGSGKVCIKSLCNLFFNLH